MADLKQYEAIFGPGFHPSMIYGYPDPIGKPGQYARLQRDLGLPKNYEDMITALSRRFIGKCDESHIHEWLRHRPSQPYRGRDGKMCKPIVIKQPRKERKSGFTMSYNSAQTRYPLRHTRERTMFLRRQKMREQPIYGYTPAGHLQLKPVKPKSDKDSDTEPCLKKARYGSKYRSSDLDHVPIEESSGQGMTSEEWKAKWRPPRDPKLYPRLSEESMQ